MPKESSDTTEAPKRAPRRRVPRKTTRVTSDSIESVPEEKPRRKSPTAFTETKTASQTQSLRRYAPLGVLVVCIITSVGIGFSDAGQIDIQALIANQPPAETRTEEGTPDSGPVTIPVQNNPSTEPGGGLLPSSDQTVPSALIPESTETASTTASSTEAVASSTESGTSEEEEVVPPPQDEVTTVSEEVVTQ